MLSTNPRAVSMRRLRSERREKTPLKPRGRKPDFAKHEALVDAYSKVAASRFASLDVLACDLGYANRNSLGNSYRWAVKVLNGSTPASPLTPTNAAQEM